jgi:CRP-like cAMP-binding protein
MHQSYQQVQPSLDAEIQQFVASMKAQMRDHTSMTEAEIEVAIAANPLRTYAKGTILLREGQIANTSYFVFKGCIREYYLKENGDEISSEFYLEGDNVSSDISKIQRVPAKHSWECMEETTVSVFTYEAEKRLFSLYPHLETVCRQHVETDMGRFRERMAFFTSASPEERYLDLMATRPTLLHRVPQYQLASYLGITPESLSRIRNRIRAQAV